MLRKIIERWRCRTLCCRPILWVWVGWIFLGWEIIAREWTRDTSGNLFWGLMKVGIY